MSTSRKPECGPRMADIRFALRSPGQIPAAAPPPPYDGAGDCFIEFGRGLVGKVHANFLSGPKPTGVLQGPSPELAAEKVEFARYRQQRWFGGQA
jgi:hypothetical protein